MLDWGIISIFHAENYIILFIGGFYLSVKDHSKLILLKG